MPARSLPSARIAVSILALALLSACAAKPQISAQTESSQYRSRAGRNYTPPGPASDPWGPYITEASKKFDVPDRWIREVMRQESGGRLYGRNGDLVTSGAGAMGLMQVMPGTYDELRARYRELGDDPYDPHNNIMAGTAYIREMYDIYGSPGFLAAYNAGPGRLDDYLTRNRTLPEETRKYVAAIGPRISGDEPRTPSPGAQFAMNALPFAIPSGTRYADSTRYSAPAASTAFANAPIGIASVAGPAIVLNPTARTAEPIQLARAPEPRYEPRGPAIVLRPQVEVAQLPEPPRPIAAPPPVQVAQLPEPPRPIYTPAPAFAPAPVFTPAATFAAREPARTQQQMAQAALVSPRPTPFAFISPANAAPIGPRHAAGSAPGPWAIQVGAYANPNLAASAATAARDHARSELAQARPTITSIRQAGATLYRARLGNLSRDAAAQACERLARARTSCMVVSPDAQS